MKLLDRHQEYRDKGSVVAKSKYKPIYAVYKAFYLNKVDPNCDYVAREVIKAFDTEDAAFEHVRELLKSNFLSAQELEEGWDLDVISTTIEELWLEIQLNATDK